MALGEAYAGEGVPFITDEGKDSVELALEAARDELRKRAAGIKQLAQGGSADPEAKPDVAAQNSYKTDKEFKKCALGAALADAVLTLYTQSGKPPEERVAELTRKLYNIQAVFPDKLNEKQFENELDKQTYRAFDQALRNPANMAIDLERNLLQRADSARGITTRTFVKELAAIGLAGVGALGLARAKENTVGKDAPLAVRNSETSIRVASGAVGALSFTGALALVNQVADMRYNPTEYKKYVDGLVETLVNQGEQIMPVMQQALKAKEKQAPIKA